MDLYPYKCAQCPRSFVLESSLEQHKAVCGTSKANDMEVCTPVSATDKAKHHEQTAAAGLKRARRRRGV